jgi:peptide/nickel transport system permease protein
MRSLALVPPIPVLGGQMGRYLLQRLLISIPVLLGITIGTYAIISLSPGDPIEALISPEASGLLGPEWVEQQREALGLNKPIPVRYGIWLKEIAQGNLGFSFVDRRPISEKMGERVWPTLKLMLTAQLIALVIALPIGILSAIRQYSFLDYLATIGGFVAISVPSFFASIAAIYLFGLQLRWMPTAGMTTVGQPSTWADSLHHLVLPAMVLGLAQAASLIRYTRSSMLEVLRQEYVNVARAKGLHERQVIIRHTLRNALLPLVTVVALGFPALLGGTVIVEQIFAWPGMGSLAIAAVRSRDYPVIMAINLVSAVMILVSSLVADILYAVVDPRIKYS